MLTQETSITDLENYSDKEKLLNVIRQQREQDLIGTTNTGEDKGGAGSSQISEGGSASRTIYGGDGSDENSEGSADGFAQQFRRSDRPTTAMHSGTDQHYKSNAKRSAWDSLKVVGKQYKNIFTKEDKNTDAPIRISKKVDGKKLSDAEAIKLRPKLVEYIMWQTEHLDQFIIATTTGHDSSIEIWGDITVDECEILVDYLLSRGKVDIRTAQAVRYASTLIDRLKLGIIIAPRVYQSAMIYIKRGFSISYV